LIEQALKKEVRARGPSSKPGSGCLEPLPEALSRLAKLQDEAPGPTLLLSPRKRQDLAPSLLSARSWAPEASPRGGLAPIEPSPRRRKGLSACITSARHGGQDGQDKESGLSCLLSPSGGKKFATTILPSRPYLADGSPLAGSALAPVSEDKGEDCMPKLTSAGKSQGSHRSELAGPTLLSNARPRASSDGLKLRVGGGSSAAAGGAPKDGASLEKTVSDSQESACAADG